MAPIRPQRRKRFPSEGAAATALGLATHNAWVEKRCTYMFVRFWFGPAVERPDVLENINAAVASLVTIAKGHGGSVVQVRRDLRWAVGRDSLEGGALPTALTLPQRHSHTPTPAPTAFPTASNRPPPNRFHIPL